MKEEKTQNHQAKELPKTETVLKKSAFASELGSTIQSLGMWAKERTSFDNMSASLQGGS